jgi:glycosyltransferase involved in cell wall biosynthesis
LTVESRRADTETLTFDQPNVKQLCVLHNPHLVTPGDDLSQVRGSYLPMFERRDRLASIVFLTNAQRADAEAHFGENANFRVIPHPGYRFAPTPFEERDPDLVVMLARLDQQKRLWHAIDVFHRVHKARPQARLEIYGHGPDRATLQAQIDRLGLRGIVTLPGFTRDPAGVYRRASLSMLTSKYEGFPLFLLETMAHGCPVVSYDVKYGPSEIISDGVDGYLVPPGDKAGMARRVVELLSDPVQRRQMSERAARPHDELSEQAFVARWSGLFRELDAAGWG